MELWCDADFCGNANPESAHMDKATARSKIQLKNTIKCKGYAQHPNNSHVKKYCESVFYYDRQYYDGQYYDYYDQQYYD